MTNQIRLYRAAEIAKLLSVSRSTFYSWIQYGKFLAGELIGPSTRIWRSNVVTEWINTHCPRTTERVACSDRRMPVTLGPPLLPGVIQMCTYSLPIMPGDGQSAASLTKAPV